MKRIGHVWEQFTSIENIELAIVKAAENKLHYRAVQIVLQNKRQYAKRLQRMLRTGKFKPSKYNAVMMATEYGKIREIFKLPFYPDRVVQHAIANVLRPIWTTALTLDTYACLPQRGINAKIKRYNLAHKLKRALQDTEHTWYCLKLDIKKCYPSISNDAVALQNARFCKDKQLLAVMELINRQGKGLLIGNYIAQLWVNLVLTLLDRFVKEVIHVRYYFRYMDDIVILHEDKQFLHQVMHRIANFLWYTLELELNRKRQIFPVDKRGIDFGGYVFFHGYTRLRKRVKHSFRRKRNLPLSVPSYTGMCKHCEGKHLVECTLAYDARMSSLADPDFEQIERPFDGKLVKIDEIIDKPIQLLDFKYGVSKFKKDTETIMMQIAYLNEKRFMQGSYSAMLNFLHKNDLRVRQRLKLEGHVDTIIRRDKLGYYFDGTVNQHYNEEPPMHLPATVTEDALTIAEQFELLSQVY